LEGLCRQLIAEQISVSNGKCTVQAELSPLPGIAYGDEALVRHILVNVLSNAIKYSPAGSKIAFTAQNDGVVAIFEVRDQGIGIPKADQARLFEAFHRAQNVGEVPGTGLGLVIVKKCVDLHEGKIELNSELGKGTTVIVRLPL